MFWRYLVPEAGLSDRLVVSTSCSLLHVPLDPDAETSPDRGCASGRPSPGRRPTRSYGSARR